MPFRYACFISYRHGQLPGIQQLYTAFEEELAQQIGLYLPNLGVYLDRSRLRGGDFFNQELANALCSSVCMVMLFNPSYFDPIHTYCAREYRAMLALEQARFALLPNNLPQKGLIIPIVVRGRLPEEVAGERHYYSMDDDLLAARDFRKQRIRQKLRRIADDIYHRYEMFRAAGVDPGGLCDSFDFPTEDDVQDWLNGVIAPPSPMPFR
jgi:hypothetical protein